MDAGTLLIDHFGAETGEFLLLEFTCFPMSDSHALEQAEKLVFADKAGVLDQWLDQERSKFEAAMEEAAKSAQ